MFGYANFIGDWTNSSGGYPPSLLHGLSKRHGSGPTLYKFDTGFNDNSGYYITDPSLVRKIEDHLIEAAGAETEEEKQDHLEELEALLYMEIAQAFGVMAVVAAARRSINDAYESGKQSGAEAAQKDIRKALGIKR